MFDSFGTQVGFAAGATQMGLLATGLLAFLLFRLVSRRLLTARLVHQLLLDSEDALNFRWVTEEKVKELEKVRQMLATMANQSMASRHDGTVEVSWDDSKRKGGQYSELSIGDRINKEVLDAAMTGGAAVVAEEKKAKEEDLPQQEEEKKKSEREHNESFYEELSIGDRIQPEVKEEAIQKSLRSFRPALVVPAPVVVPQQKEEESPKEVTMTSSTDSSQTNISIIPKTPPPPPPPASPPISAPRSESMKAPSIMNLTTQPLASVSAAPHSPHSQALGPETQQASVEVTGSETTAELQPSQQPPSASLF